MDPASDMFILAVPGSDQTRQLSREDVLNELSTGEITSEFWVWSPADGDWKQISEFPELQPPPPAPTPSPAPKLVVSPAPIAKMTVNPNPQLAVTPPARSNVTGNPTPQFAVSPTPIPKITVNSPPASSTPFVPRSKTAAASPIMPLLTPKQAAAPPAAKGLPPLASPAPAATRQNTEFVAPIAAPIGKTTVHVAPAAAGKKKRVVQPRGGRVEEDEGIPYLQILFGLLYLAVAGIVLANYLLVDKVLDQSLDHTSFVLVPTHAHLGSFVQPNALVIHVLPNSELTPANLPDYLQVVAKNTPGQPFNHMPFTMVALTSSWFSQYVLTGDDWQSLAKMNGAGPEERKEFIVDHLCTTTGRPLISRAATAGGVDLKAERDRVWQDFSAQLVKKSNG